ncbi:MAG: hypothetical protein JNL58_30325 [Planctomyces sp.]|nr:hypothetical protein [Planctomyces sp.]
MSNQNFNPYSTAVGSDVEKRQPSSDRLGCLLSIIGAVVGTVIGFWRESSIVAAIRADDPDTFIDFLPVPGFFGFVVGGVAGPVIGKVISTFVRYRANRK